MPLDRLNPSHRQRGLTLEQINARLDERGIPFPCFVRADLEEEQRTNAGTGLHEYDLGIDPSPG